MFAPATMPDDHALTTNALRGAYEMEAAMAKLALSPSVHVPVQSSASTGLSTDPLADAIEEQLRKAINGAAAKLKVHEETRASWSQPDDDSCTSDEESMPDDDDNTDEDETSGEKTPGTNEVPNQQEKTDLGETRAPIKLKLFRKTPQTDDSDTNAITKSMNEHTLGVDGNSTDAIHESSRGWLLQRRSPKLQRSGTGSPRQSNSVVDPKEQEDDCDERHERDKDRLSRRGVGKRVTKSGPDGRHPMGGMHVALRSIPAGQHAQTTSNQKSPLDPHSRHDKIDSDFDDSRVPNPDDSDDDMHGDMSNRQAYLAGAVADEDDEILGHTRARRRSFDVEAENYDDWEGFVDADESDCYGGSEDDGDEEDENIDEEDDEDEKEEEDEDEEDGDANFDRKYGWSQPQSDRIRYAPPPRPYFDMLSQPSSSHLEEQAGAHVTESIENNVSEEQINESLAEELRRTRLDETQPGA